MNTENQTFPSSLNVAEKLKSANLADIRNIRNSHLPKDENEHTEYAIPASLYDKVSGIQKEIDSFLAEKIEEVQEIVDNTLKTASERLSEKDMESPFLPASIPIPTVSLKSELVAGFQESAIIAWYEREGIERPVKETSGGKPSEDLGITF